MILHESKTLRDKIKEFLRRYKKSQILYSYKTGTDPSATLASPSVKFEIPIPSSPYPYKTWNHWFIYRLEQIIRQVSEEEGVSVKLFISKEKILPLYNATKEYDEDEY